MEEVRRIINELGMFDGYRQIQIREEQ
jgi:hypothetical protein